MSKKIVNFSQLEKKVNHFYWFFHSNSILSTKFTSILLWINLPPYQDKIAFLVGKICFQWKTWKSCKLFLEMNLQFLTFKKPLAWEILNLRFVLFKKTYFHISEFLHDIDPFYWVHRNLKKNEQNQRLLIF